MLSSAPLELLNIMVLKEKSEEVLSHLLALGIFHPVDLREVEKDIQELSPYQTEKEYGEWDEREIALGQLLRDLAVDVEAAGTLENFSLEKVKEVIAEIEQKTSSLREERSSALNELKIKEAMLAQVKDLPFKLKTRTAYTFLEIAFGRIAENTIPVLVKELEHIPHVLYPFREEENRKFLTLLIVLRRDKAVLEKALKLVLWENVEYPSDSTGLTEDLAKEIRKEIADEKLKLSKSILKIKAIAENYRQILEKILLFILLKKSLLQAKKYSYTTDRTILLSGWVPVADVESVIGEISAISESTYVEGKKAEDTPIPKEDIPVKLKHNVLLKPFGLLLESYGLPRYGSVDPTVFVAFSFLLMFGAMFGDLGQGMVLVLIGVLLFRNKAEKVKQSGTLVLYCGLSSTIFGALYGSIFGFEFHSIIPNPINNIMGMFQVSVIFGIVIISLGIVLHVINSFRDKEYAKALFDKTGLIAGIVYWIGLAIVVKLYIFKNGISSFYLVAFAMGLAALFLKPFIDYFQQKKRENIFLFLIEEGIDFVEFFMGYLANTISFIRVAAFALAHAGLFMAIFQLSKMMENFGGGVFSIVIIILGNIFVIILEGLVVTIQSIRLNYYEFFSKFFVTGKKEFKPLKI